MPGIKNQEASIEKLDSSHETLDPTKGMKDKQDARLRPSFVNKMGGAKLPSHSHPIRGAGLVAGSPARGRGMKISSIIGPKTVGLESAIDALVLGKAEYREN